MASPFFHSRYPARYSGVRIENRCRSERNRSFLWTESRRSEDDISRTFAMSNTEGETCWGNSSHSHMFRNRINQKMISVPHFSKVEAVRFVWEKANWSGYRCGFPIQSPCRGLSRLRRILERVFARKFVRPRNIGGLSVTKWVRSCDLREGRNSALS